MWHQEKREKAMKLQNIIKTQKGTFKSSYARETMRCVKLSKNIS